MYFSNPAIKLSKKIISLCTKAGLKISIAESCTGGLINAALTEISGCSAVVEKGFVVYSNQAKSDLLKVPSQLFETVGAVSSEVAKAMADGARISAGADLALSVTGIAGPSGGSKEKPVGLVYFGISTSPTNTYFHKIQFDQQDRSIIRAQAVETALDLLITEIQSFESSP